MDTRAQTTARAQLAGDTMRFLDWFGVAVAGWVALLAWLTPAAPQRPAVMWGGAGALAVLAVAAPTVGRRDRRSWLALWVVAAAAAELAGPLSGTGGWSVAAATGFVPLIAAAAVGGRLRIALVTAVLGAAAFARPLVDDAWTTGAAAVTALQYLIAGIALHHAFAILCRGLVERQELRDDLAAAETAEAIASERAEASARLHDTVLQHLVSIGHADSLEDARHRAARASADLRRFLRGGRAGASTREALEALVAEAAAGVDVRFSAAGDAPLADRTAALVEAAAEAVRNAARHGRPPVTVFAELAADVARVYVTDRGDGFDPAAVGPDRLGVRGSIVDRIHRAGGSATLTCRPGRTEWALTVPPTPDRLDGATGGDS
jgi:signal transduction histidine kinase